MKIKLKHRFFLALILLILALVVYACSKETAPAEQGDSNLDITVVVMKRDAKVTGPIMIGGPIKSDRYNVTMPSDSTVQELKSIVFQLTGLAHFEQKKIVYKSQTLDTQHTLEYYNVTDGSRIHIFTENVI